MACFLEVGKSLTSFSIDFGRRFYYNHDTFKAMFVLCQIYFSKKYQNLYTKFRGSQVSLTWINNITAVHFYSTEKAGEHVSKITDVKSNIISIRILLLISNHN